MLDLRDFYSTSDDYRYRFESEAKERFLSLLRERFNSGVRYRERALKWDTVVEQKTVELGRYFAGPVARLDFTEPSAELSRTDSRELRRRILGLSQRDAAKFGIGRSTLRYLRKNAIASKRLRVYKPVIPRVKAGLSLIASRS
jgi:hypothetical protein